jgi:predicted nucleic acid-binding protein
MVYADSDFFLALSKKEDWLKTGAKKIYDEYKGHIETSVLTLAELFLVAKRQEMDTEILVGSVFQMADVKNITVEQAMEVAHHIKKNNFSVFDAFNIVFAEDQPIISSDKKYEKIGVRVIQLKTIPEGKIKNARGFIPGVSSENLRDESERFG